MVVLFVTQVVLYFVVEHSKKLRVRMYYLINDDLRIVRVSECA